MTHLEIFDIIRIMKRLIAICVFITALRADALALDAVGFPGAPAVPANAGAGLSAAAFADGGTTKLSAQTFPKTFQDLSFADRMNVLREGYAPWESEYDQNGNCIVNCPYKGIKLEDYEDMLRRNTEEARYARYMYEMKNPPLPAPVATADDAVDIPAVGGPGPEFAPPIGAGICAPRHQGIVGDQFIPNGMPLTGPVRMSDGFGKRIHPITKNWQMHTGVDLSAKTGTPIFSTLTGVVDMAGYHGHCGNAVRVVAKESGYAVLFCHLDKIMVSKGETVVSGCQVGTVGNTGRSTGPHLHYSIYYRMEFVDPASFLGM